MARSLGFKLNFNRTRCCFRIKMSFESILISEDSGYLDFDFKNQEENIEYLIEEEGLEESTPALHEQSRPLSVLGKQ